MYRSSESVFKYINNVWNFISALKNRDDECFVVRLAYEAEIAAQYNSTVQYFTVYTIQSTIHMRHTYAYACMHAIAVVHIHKARQKHIICILDEFSK